MRLLLIASSISAAQATMAQELDARQTRALDCAAIFYAGVTELERLGRIDSATAKTVQGVAKDFLDEVPGRRRAKTDLVNARITALAKGKTREQLLLDFNKRRKACESEFLG